MVNQYQVSYFKANKIQSLRNITIYSPAIIQVIAGVKKVFWRNQILEINSSKLLFCHSGTKLNFTNTPATVPNHQSTFLSKVFSFNLAPSNEILYIASQNYINYNHINPTIKANCEILNHLNALTSFDLNTISKQTQRYLLMALYQQLAEQGDLSKLFNYDDLSFTQKVSNYLAITPQDTHHLDGVATNFAMSRATLIRKLKRESMQYKDILLDVRLNHALSLIQEGVADINDLADKCGYKSTQRFVSRFKEKFGITPSSYFKTIAHKL